MLLFPFILHFMLFQAMAIETPPHLKNILSPFLTNKGTRIEHLKSQFISPISPLVQLHVCMVIKNKASIACSQNILQRSKCLASNKSHKQGGVSKRGYMERRTGSFYFQLTNLNIIQTKKDKKSLFTDSWYLVRGTVKWCQICSHITTCPHHNWYLCLFGSEGISGLGDCSHALGNGPFTLRDNYWLVDRLLWLIVQRSSVFGEVNLPEHKLFQK